MNVIKFLNKLGLSTIEPSWFNRESVWLDWYAGDTEFHRYVIYNGQEYITRHRKTLKMAKKVCEDKADLLLNEKVTITTKEQEYLKDVLDKNAFWTSGNQLVEFAAAGGTGAFVEYLDKGEPRIDFVQAKCIFPISWRNGIITECAFASSIGKGVTYINTHLRDAGGKYIVSNYYISGESKPVQLPEGMKEVWETGRTDPLFQIVKLNIANNFDPSSPMGISAFANAIDVLESLDMVYDSYFNEFKLGKKRVFVSDSMLKIDVSTGKQIPIFDSNDTEFYGIPGETTDDITKNLQELNGDLRFEAHRAGIQDNLDLLSDKVGFGRGYYKFEADGVKTATEVISANSKLFRKIKRDEIILEKALTDMVRALLFLGGKPDDAEIMIKFDDSIIEDKATEAKQALLELQSEAIDKVIYHQRVYGLTEEAAIKLVAKMAARAPAQADFGGMLMPDDTPTPTDNGGNV